MKRTASSCSSASSSFCYGSEAHTHCQSISSSLAEVSPLMNAFVFYLPDYEFRLAELVLDRSRRRYRRDKTARNREGSYSSRRPEKS